MKLTTTWDLSRLGKSINDPAFTTERSKTEKMYKAFSKKWKTNQDYLKKPLVLKQALDEYEKLAADEGKEDRYLWLRSCLDTQDPEIQAAMTRYRDFGNKMADYVRFFDLSLATITKENQKKFLGSEALKEYKQYLKDIFDNANYLLSEKEERILSMKSSVASQNWVDMLDEFLSGESREVWTKEGKQEQSFTQIMSNLRTAQPKILTSNINALTEILGKHAKVAEKEINSFLENKKINDELRGFKRPDSSRHIAESIDTKAVDTLVEVVQKNYKISRDFYTFKAKLLGKKTFHYHERNTEFGSVDKDFSYPETVTIVEKSLRRISDEFADYFVSFSTEGQIDVHPKKGKTGGAFCLPGYREDVNIMLNFGNSFRDITTLAHEMGHGIHAMKARKENALNYGVPMCTAEVASTFCEDFVVDELNHRLRDNERLTLLVAKLEDKITTIFRQIAAYTFEQDLHKLFREKGYLTEQEIGKLFNKHMKAYMGSSVTFDEHSGRGWIYWSHFRNPFYVYAYSMALLVAQFARKQFLKNPSYKEKINQFYSTGSSLPPAAIFKNLGLDVYNPQSWQEGIDEVKDLLTEAKKLAKKLGKI